jgi:hypothetical protein
MRRDFSQSLINDVQFFLKRRNQGSETFSQENQMEKRQVSAALLILAAGCSSGRNDVYPVEQNAAGITSVTIERHDGQTVVSGIDAAGVTIATASLHVGTVHYSLDEGTTYQDGYGRDLFIQVADEPSFEHVSPGTPALDLPAPPLAKTSAFLAIPAVGHAFDGVTFRTAPASGVLTDGEGAYGSAGPSFSNFGNSCPACAFNRNAACGTNTCARFFQNGQVEDEYVCCAGTSAALHRYCSGNPGGTNSCGPVGPQGCAVCWTSPWTSSCTASGSVIYVSPQGWECFANMSWT